MIGFIRKLIKDRRGNALILAGMLLPLIVGAAGLANDTIQWTLWKRQLQRAADSAAIAGAYDRYNSAGSTSTVASTVTHDLGLNLHTWMALKSGYPDVKYDSDCAVAGSSATMTNRVCVTIAVQQKLAFSSMFLSTPPTITAKATAAAVPAGGDPCFFAKEWTATTGLNFTGNAAIEAPDCDGFSNSTATNSSVAKGSSTVTLNTIGAVGGVQQSNNFKVSAYRPYSPKIDDPFESVDPNPSDMKCAGHYDKKGVWQYDALTEDTDMGEAKAQDGSKANCFTSLSVGSNKTLTVPANYGPIYLNGGDATLQGSFTCSGCTIVLTNKDSASPIGNIKVNASANVNITPPTGTGDKFKGIAIYQDRRATDCNACNKVNGNSGSVIQGAIYFPSQELEYNGTGNTSAQCTMFIARRLNFSGNSSTSNKFKKLADCGAFGLPNGSSSFMVRLVG
jgi:Flp pilus assembly protein TadG